MKIYTSIQKLKMDPKGYLFILWFLLRQKTGCFISTRITYIICRLKGVNIGKKNIFKGITYFERLPNSKISIGNNCQFYSSFNSNSIGVLQRCRIATLTQNSEIIIGDNVGMTGVNIGAAQSIIIGDKTLIGGNSIITDTDWHSLEIDYRHCGIEKAISTPTIIGKNVFNKKCKRLKVIFIKSTKLTKFEKNKISKKCKIIVPKSKVKKYTKLVKKWR